MRTIFLQVPITDLESQIDNEMQGIINVVKIVIALITFIFFARFVIKLMMGESVWQSDANGNLEKVIQAGNEFRVDARSNKDAEVRYFVEYKKPGGDWNSHMSTSKHNKALKELEKLKKERDNLDGSFSESVLTVE